MDPDDLGKAPEPKTRRLNSPDNAVTVCTHTTITTATTTLITTSVLISSSICSGFAGTVTSTETTAIYSLLNFKALDLPQHFLQQPPPQSQPLLQQQSARLLNLIQIPLHQPLLVQKVPLVIAVILHMQYQQPQLNLQLLFCKHTLVLIILLCAFYVQKN